MKTIACIKLSFLILFVSLFLSCVKEGPRGPAGLDGNANVLSQVFTVAPSAWYASGTSLYADIYTNILTNSVIDNGAVLVFTEGNPNEWQTLPYTWPGNNEFWGFWCASGLVTIEINDGSGYVPSTPATTYFKIVAIDGYAAMSNETKKRIIQQEMYNIEPKL